LKVKPWVKPSLGPGSLVVTDYLKKAGVHRSAGSAGSTSSATAARPASATPARCRPKSSKGIADGDLVVASVLSGNRNFEGRVHPEVKMNYLASPPLVVAYAIAGTVDIDLARSARHRPERQSGLPQGHLAEQQGDLRRHPCHHHVRTCSTRTMPTCSRATAAGTRCRVRRATATSGTIRPTSSIRRTSKA
jgi:aconitase A